jgi:hypothetical protein
MVSNNFQNKVSMVLNYSPNAFEKFKNIKDLKQVKIYLF